MLSPSYQAEVELERRRRTRHDGPAVTAAEVYHDDPAAFVLDCFDWKGRRGPAEYQLDVLANLAKRKRVTVRAPHGAGKTALAAWAVLWFVLTRYDEDWKVPTTASAWRQLTKFLWPEIRKWARLIKWDKVGIDPFDERTELLSLSIKLEHGEAFAMASDNSDLIEGAHAENLLYIFDESKAIPADTWDSAEGAFSTGDAHWLAISTPGEPNGRFYDLHRRAPGYDDWWTKHITLGDAIAAGRINPEWAKQRAKQWGENSAVYQNRVEGEFATSDEDGVIALALVEAANERWYKQNETGEWGDFTCVGVDVGRGGDKSIMALRHLWSIKELREDTKKNVMSVTGKTAGILRKYGGDAVVDVIGIGAGVVDSLRDDGFSVQAFNASAKTDQTDESGELLFTNMRSFAWWNMREVLANEEVALPPDDELTGDLTAPRWKVRAGGRIQVEPKEEIKKRIGRSTDCGDAVVMAFSGGSLSALDSIAWI